MKKLLYISIATVMPLLVLAQTTTKNYIKSTIFQVETTTGNVNNDQKIETITYFDGLGRPMQSIAKQAGGNKEDLITPYAYDYFGRKIKDYLPYARSASSLNIEESLLPDPWGDILELNNFYATKYPDDFTGMYIEEINPFSQTYLEASPINRVRKQGTPGASWKVDKYSNYDHTTKFEYNANSESDNVKNFKVFFVAGNKSDPLLQVQGIYTPLELYKTIIKNENWTSGKNNTTEEYKDKEGHIVLKRMFSDYRDSNGQLISAETPHDTYYVYDVYGNLTFVLPPKAVDLIGTTSIQTTLTSTAVITSGNSLNLTSSGSIDLMPSFNAQTGSNFSALINTVSGDNLAVLNNLCYQYRYDSRNRLIEKKLPGREWEYIIYDKLDRPILTQDGNLKSNNKWLFTKYDAFGRAIYTGEYVNAVETTRDLIQNLANNNAFLFENKTTAAENINGTNVNYTNVAFPKAGIDLLSITYYDNYLNFDLDGGGAIPSSVTPVVNPKGLATATKIRTLGTSLWTTTVNYYDNKGRGIYTYNKNNFLSAVNTVKSNFDFVKLLETTTIHKKATADLVIVDTFTYDHAGRILTQKQKINSQPQEIIYANTYDYLGQLITKVVGGVQTVNYNYNIRGWLKSINNVNNIGSDLFAFQIKYNDITDNSKKLFNGNISQTLWKTAHTDTSIRSYLYTYDALNRLTTATDNLGRYNENPTYDKNGNILTMFRTGNTILNTPSYGTIDNLAYTYDAGNKLLKVEDISANIQGFSNGNSASNTDYGYDNNGNMTNDANKGISGISYNHLNLPLQISLQAGNINYFYDATGVKQRKIVNGITTDYAGGFQYENDILQFFPHSEGYVRNNAGVYEYIYQYKDHLGNIRLSYNKNLNVIEENNYYPFGLKQSRHDDIINTQGNATAQKYKYNGKEFQDENIGGAQLNLYDYHARNYDPALGRWMNIDPLAEMSRRWSPYTYCYNNPLRYTDPDGMMAEDELREIWRRSEEGEDTKWSFHEDGTATGSNGKTINIEQSHEIGDSNGDIDPNKKGGQTGSYTNTHESGKKYHGKGPKDRANKSGKRIAKEHDDPLVDTDWTPATDDKQAFKDEDDRIKTDEGGHKSDNNYNKRRSPGEKIKEKELQEAANKAAKTGAAVTTAYIVYKIVVALATWECLGCGALVTP